MFRAIAFLTIVGFGLSGQVLGGPGEDINILGRGDSNNDHVVNVSDVVHMNSYLYNGGPAPPCLNNADANGDGAFNNSDPVYLLNWLYNGGSAPPAPGPNNQSCVPVSPSLHSCDASC